MLDGPIGAAAFNNEFGRPSICGYFRTFEQHQPGDPRRSRGYHKPIMIAGGLGNVRRAHIQKGSSRSGPPGGARWPGHAHRPGRRRGLLLGSGASHEELDFGSVQRGNPEMQRRAQEVIDACWALGAENRSSSYDVGAGGLSNAVPEAVAHSARGARINLRHTQRGTGHVAA
jgi:phosphoribosylformylglycinamidine synthase